MQSDAIDHSALDEALITRIESMSGGSQRWLKTVLQTISVSDDAPDQPLSPPRAAKPQAPMRETPRAPDLEDVLSGKISLGEQLERYPELAEEFDGLSDIIDLLRDAGESRRSRGEQILREEILGDDSEPESGPDGDEPA